MWSEFQEGDLVRHPSCAVPIRVIGVGPSIAVVFPTGVMRAYEPCELKKVADGAHQPGSQNAPAGISDPRVE
jgi:hypothetical protein